MPTYELQIGQTVFLEHFLFRESLAGTYIVTKKFLTSIRTTLLVCAWSASGFAQTTIPENDPYLQDYILTHPLGEPPPDYSEISSALELIPS
jgi:hypothetical protein